MGCRQRERGWTSDPDALREERAVHGTFEGIAAAHGGHSDTYARAWRKHVREPLPKGPQPAAPTDEGVDLTVDRIDDINRELRGRGLNPDEWVVVRVVVNTWDSVADGAPLPLKQLKVTLRPRLDTLIAPATAAPVPRLPKPAKPDKTKPRLVVFVGDEQAPYHDETLHRLFCQWLHANKPHEAVHLGDLMDFPTISRHRTNPAWNASPQECVNAGYTILRNYRQASPATVWRALPGNHDERIRDYQLGRAAELYGVTAADVEIEAAPALSLRNLLHLDALTVEWLGGHGDYEHAQADVSDTLAARHGWITGANSAEKTVRRLGLNVVVGHTHRQRVTYVTEQRMREDLTMVCVEAGAMCQVEGGLGYTINPDWARGFATANVWPDGAFTVDHGTYRGGVLTWRDQRYT